jgi:hypothetical protein
LLFVGNAAWVVACLVASVVHRRLRGKPLVSRVPAGSVHVERWTSGRSNRSLLARLGGANNCLLVAVTPDFLVVRPHFPFTLMFLPELFALELEIPRSAITRVEHQRGLLGSTVAVRFREADGRPGLVEFRLRNAAEFLAHLQGRGRPS